MQASSSGPVTVSSASSGAFFSLGEDDDPVSLSNANSPIKTPTPATNNSGNIYDVMTMFSCPPRVKCDIGNVTHNTHLCLLLTADSLLPAPPKCFFISEQSSS